MTIDRELHKAKLEELLKKHGGPKPLAAAIARGVVAPEKPIDPTQISNALSDYRPFGEKVRRKIERSLGLPDLWFEDAGPSKEGARRQARKQLSEGATWIGRVFDRLPSDRQALVLEEVLSFVESKARDLERQMPSAIKKLRGDPGDVSKAKSRTRRSDRTPRRVSKSDA